MIDENVHEISVTSCSGRSEDKVGEYDLHWDDPEVDTDIFDILQEES